MLDCWNEHLNIRGQPPHHVTNDGVRVLLFQTEGSGVTLLRAKFPASGVVTSDLKGQTNKYKFIQSRCYQDGYLVHSASSVLRDEASGTDDHDNLVYPAPR